MLTKLVELALRTILNAAGGHIQDRRKPKMQPQKDIVISSDAWNIGQELLLKDQLIDEGNPIALSFNDLKRSVHITGCPGSGKTTMALSLVDYLLVNKKNMVIADFQGDLVDQAKLHLAAYGSPDYWRQNGRLLIIDLRKSLAVPFNPLAGSGTAHSRAMRCLDIIRTRSLSWGVTIESCLFNVFLALASVTPAYTLLETEALLTNTDFREDVLKSLNDPYAELWFMRYAALSSEQQQSLIQASLNKIEPLLTMPSIRRMIGQRDTVDFRRLLDTPGCVILIALNSNELHSAASMLGSLIVSAIIQAVFSRIDVPEGEKSRPPIGLIIDEFENFVGPDFASIIQEGRRFGLYSVLSHQTLGQTGEMSDLLLNAVHLRVAFQTGYSDAVRISKETSGEFRKEVADRLLTLPVGQAFLIEKGATTRLIQAANSNASVVSPEMISALEDLSAANYAKPAYLVDKEIKERLISRAKGNSESALSKPNKRMTSRPAKTPEANTVYEVRPRKVKTMTSKEDDNAGK